MKLRHLLSSIVLASAVFFVGTKPATANPVGGIVSATFVVRPGASKYTEIVMRGRELTRIRVAGDGDGDIDCVVISPRGNVVAIDNDSTDTCLLMVTPVQTEEYKVIIKNSGEASTLVNLIAD